MRKIGLGKDAQGRKRILLNDKFVFQMGALDQGYWPDGIYTAPTDAALRYDIEATKNSASTWCASTSRSSRSAGTTGPTNSGLLVWQDMPQRCSAAANGVRCPTRPSSSSRTSSPSDRRGCTTTRLSSCGTTFNEGWGQHDTTGSWRW